MQPNLPRQIVWEMSDVLSNKEHGVRGHPLVTSRWGGGREESLNPCRRVTHTDTQTLGDSHTIVLLIEAKMWHDVALMLLWS